MNIEENINNLEKYIEEDSIYNEYLKKDNTLFTTSDEKQINHCKDIDYVLKHLANTEGLLEHELERNKDLIKMSNIEELLKEK